MSPKTTPSAAKLKPATPIAEAGLRFSAEILITRISMDHSITAQRLSLILVRRTSDAEEPDHRHRRLLRARREWPRDSRAPEQRDELAPPHHSITSSAVARSDGGTVSPSILAVCMLMTSSNLLD